MPLEQATRMGSPSHLQSLSHHITIELPWQTNIEPNKHTSGRLPDLQFSSPLIRVLITSVKQSGPIIETTRPFRPELPQVVYSGSLLSLK